MNESTLNLRTRNVRTAPYQYIENVYYTFTRVGGAGAITDPDLNAFAENGPKPGAPFAWDLRDNSGDPLGEEDVTITPYGWTQFNLMLKEELDAGKIDQQFVEEIRSGLKFLMGEAKKDGIKKVYFTFYVLEYEGNGKLIDAIDVERSKYKISEGEGFAFNDFSKTTSNLKANMYNIMIDLDDGAGKQVGVITFTPSSRTGTGEDESGCNAGFGMIALLLAGFLTRRFRKA